MPELADEVLADLERDNGPIVANFTFTEIPDGAAPMHIREQWVGVTVPIREQKLGNLATLYLDALSSRLKVNEEPVPIVGVEAVHALEAAGKPNAARFWAPYGLAEFVFRASEGELVQIEAV